MNRHPDRAERAKLEAMRAAAPELAAIAADLARVLRRVLAETPAAEFKRVRTSRGFGLNLARATLNRHDAALRAAGVIE